ncbi:hypothetical protein ACOMHN_017529 [Nucella lapillus]
MAILGIEKLVVCNVAGPYWCLLGGSIHYLDFYTYIARLITILRDWQQDASPALDPEFCPLFPDIPFQYDGTILQSLLAIDEEKKRSVKSLLQKVCAGMVKVTERQLADFLPEGKYFGVEDPVLRDKLKHSHITNLLSEECFADLDFSQFKRRSASLHHHSTVNMLKRNMSMSSWFLHKSAEQQKDLLQLSSKKAASLREKHAQLEKDAVRRRRDLLLENQWKKQAAEERERQRVLSIVEDLQPHQGPCSSPADINRLLEQYSTKSGLKKALRAEVLFQKLVLFKKSPLLKVTGTALTLVNRLLELFEGPTLTTLPPLRAHPLHRGLPARKRPRRAVHTDESDSDAETDQEEELQAASDATEGWTAELDYMQFSFKFQQLGEIVAVYYEDDFFIGEVANIHNEEEAEISFMEKTKSLINGSCIYRWPRREDTYPISSAVIFAGKIAIAPSSSTGRSFIVETPDNLPGRYEVFRQHLVDNLL